MKRLTSEINSRAIQYIQIILQNFENASTTIKITVVMQWVRCD
jgi:hypothetical protein